MSIKSLKQDNDLIISNLSIKAKEAEDLPMLNSGGFVA